MLHQIKMYQINYQKQIKVISTKGLTKKFIDKFSVFNRAKYFPSEIFQNYLVFIPAKNTSKILLTLLGLTSRNLMENWKKVLKI